MKNYILNKIEGDHKALTNRIIKSSNSRNIFFFIIYNKYCVDIFHYLHAI